MNKNIIFSSVLTIASQITPVEAQNKDVSDFVGNILETPCGENITITLNYKGLELQNFIQNTFGVEVEDCILNELGNIQNIKNILLKFYGKNNSQIKTDIDQNSIHFLEIFSNQYLLQDILNYHLQFPNIQKTVKNYDLYILIFHNKNRIYDTTDIIQKINPQNEISHQLINIIEIFINDQKSYEKYIPKIEYLSKIGYKLPQHLIQGEKTNYSNIFGNISELYYLVNNGYIYNFLEKQNYFIQNSFSNYFEGLNLYNSKPLEEISKNNDQEKLQQIINIKKLFDEINQETSFIGIIKILEINTFTDIKNIFLYLKNHTSENQKKIIRKLHITDISSVTNGDDLEKLFLQPISKKYHAIEKLTKLMESDKYSQISGHKNLILTSDNPGFYLSNMQELIKIYNSGKSKQLLQFLDAINKPIFIHGLHELFMQKITLSPYKNIEFSNEEFEKGLKRLVIYINSSDNLENTQFDQKIKFKQIIYDINSGKNVSKILEILGLFQNQINSMQGVINLFNDEKYDKYLHNKNFHNYIKKYNLLYPEEKIHINKISFIFELYKNNTSLELLNKERLLGLLSKKLKTKRTVHRVDSNGIKYDDFNLKKLENLNIIELLELLYFLRGLENKEVKQEIINLLDLDYQDTSSEAGGKIKIDGNSNIKIVSFESKSKNDGQYLPTEEFHKKNIEYNYDFHIHGVKNINNLVYAGPSTLDIIGNTYYQKISIVITRINENSYNIDLYKSMDTVIDLGIYNLK